ncbi:Unknown protein, partial [Striga hermonthica]
IHPRIRSGLVFPQVVASKRHQMLDVKNVMCVNMRRKPQAIGIRVDFLNHLHRTDLPSRELIILRSRETILRKYRPDKITDFELHITTTNIGPPLVRGGGSLQTSTRLVMCCPQALYQLGRTAILRARRWKKYQIRGPAGNRRVYHLKRRESRGPADRRVVSKLRLRQALVPSPNIIPHEAAKEITQRTIDHLIDDKSAHAISHRACGLKNTMAFQRLRDRIPRFQTSTPQDKSSSHITRIMLLHNLRLLVINRRPIVQPARLTIILFGKHGPRSGPAQTHTPNMALFATPETLRPRPDARTTRRRS